jgi:nucleoside 2-deoxyribosyltransferase
MGFEVFIALCGKSYLKNEREFMATGYKQPLSTDHAITQRDWWMCRKCDILLVNLIGAKKISIGTVMEMAWAFDHGKHIITVMENDNIHQHAFVKEVSSIVYDNFQDALDYLSKLSKMEI